MADPILNINQGDTIYFYDTSIGNISSWNWSFVGGTPSTATTQNVYVTFNSSYISGFSVSLSVTDTGGISSSIAENNIIVVNPEVITSSFTLSNTSRLMSQTQTYTSGATASSGIAAYNWIIPGLGLTSGAVLPSISHTENNWINVAGTYAGSPNSSVLRTASLTIDSNVGNTSTSNSNVTYYKMGPAESYSLDPIGLSGPYYGVSYLTTSGSLGIGGPSLVFLIEQSSIGATASFANQYFHSNNEVFYFVPNTTDLTNEATPPNIRMKIIVSKSAWDLGGLTYSSNDEFSEGNYILPGGFNDVLGKQLCVTDYTTTSPNTLTSLTTYSRGWEISDIVELLKNTYYSSSSSKFIENLNVFLTSKGLNSSSVGGYDWIGGYGPLGGLPGVLVPSSWFFWSYYGTAIEVSLTARITDTNGSTITVLKITLSPVDSFGNSPDTYIITANNTIYNTQSGIAKLIGDALEGSNFSGNFVVESGTAWSPYHQQTSDLFPGMRISIRDPYNSYYHKNIASISLEWSNAYLTDLSSLGIPDNSLLRSPFTSETVDSFTGIRGNACLRTPIDPGLRRGWIIGGEIG